MCARVCVSRSHLELWWLVSKHHVPVVLDTTLGENGARFDMTDTLMETELLEAWLEHRALPYQIALVVLHEIVDVIVVGNVGLAAILLVHVIVVAHTFLSLLGPVDTS